MLKTTHIRNQIRDSLLHEEGVYGPGVYNTIMKNGVFEKNTIFYHVELSVNNMRRANSLPK